MGFPLVGLIVTGLIDDWSWIVGGGQGIVRDPESGALIAGADPRRDGYALAI